MGPFLCNALNSTLTLQSKLHPTFQLLGFYSNLLTTAVLFTKKVLLSDHPVIKTLQYQNTPLPKCRVNEHEDQANCNRRDIEPLSCPELNITQHDWLISLRCLCQTRDDYANCNI